MRETAAAEKSSDRFVSGIIWLGYLSPQGLE